MSKKSYEYFSSNKFSHKKRVVKNAYPYFSFNLTSLFNYDLGGSVILHNPLWLAHSYRKFEILFPMVKLNILNKMSFVYGLLDGIFNYLLTILLGAIRAGTR